MMRYRWMVLVVAVGMQGRADAGGLILPGAGAVSTSRAGAAVVSADDGEAFVLNPAGLAKTEGTTITVSAAMISYAMKFTRRGTYDDVPGQAYPYAGRLFAVTENDADPPYGIGSMQPVPVLAVISDLGGLVPGLRVGAGLYAPNAYPFRDLCTQVPAGCQKYVFNDNPDLTPPPARYDIMKQEAAILMPSLGVAYRALPVLDVGIRLSAGRAQLKSTTAVWGTLEANLSEDIRKDAVFAVDATDSFVLGYGLGATYRPLPYLEVAASYSSKLDVHAQGTATAELGTSTGLPGMPVTIGAVEDAEARCAPGGRADALVTCVDLALPMSVALGGRLHWEDARGQPRGDVELDLVWENWGKQCGDDELADGSCASPGDYRVVVDGTTQTAGADGTQVPLLRLRDVIVHHGLRDTYSVRLGGSYHIPVGAQRDDGATNRLIMRAGYAYETGAAKPGWLRADLDGAARSTLTIGVGFRTSRFEVNAGGGFIHQGTPTNLNVGGGREPCNPTVASPPGEPACGVTPRQGPDPINPIRTPSMQTENPVSQGVYQAHYTLLMLGVTTWF